MELEWIYQADQPQLVRNFLQEQGIPRKFLSAVKYRGGSILLNGQAVTVRASLRPGDRLKVQAAPELGHETVPASQLPIEIVYEDLDCLVVNKPINTVSIPSQKHPDSSMANRIKGYYQQQGYSDQVIHIVTRLDRDTSGLMLIAKHRLAHAYFDQQIRNKTIKKYYYAISEGIDWPREGLIDAPIGRHPDSIIQRRVDVSGRPALTRFWVQDKYPEATLLKLQLLTGRTHQIRVHLAHLGGPLVGDTLYGGSYQDQIQRQALHCGQLEFKQPFSHEQIILKQALPADMQAWLEAQA